MTMVAGSTVTRFGLSQIAGNQVVDWNAVEGNYENLGNNAAHLTLGNSFTGNQLIAGNLGVTGPARRITLAVPSATESNNTLIQAEANSALGTWVGVTAPANASAGQRKASLVLHGVAPVGVNPPASLTFLVDEDAHRLSIQAVNNYQDLTAPSLQLGAGGNDRIVIPAALATAIAVTGALTMTGNLAAVNGAFSGTFAATGAAQLGNTITVAGLATLNAGLTVAAGTSTFSGPVNINAVVSTQSLTVGGSLTVNGPLNQNGNITLVGSELVSGNMTISGTTQLNGVEYFGSGGAYVQAYGGDNTYIQISKLTVTPGTTSLAGVTVNGNETLNGTMTCGATIIVNGAGWAFNATAGGMLIAYNTSYAARDSGGTPRGMVQWDSGNNVMLYGGTAGSLRIVNYANSVQCAHFDTYNFYCDSGSIFAAGSVSAGSQVYTTPGGSLYLRGADGNVHIDTGGASLWANTAMYTNLMGCSGRGYFGNWDAGQALNVGGHILASGYIFNRGSTSYRCWDNADFNFSPGNYGGYVVQRDGNGNFSCSNGNFSNGVTCVGGSGLTFGSGNAGVWPGTNISRGADTVYITYGLYVWSQIDAGGWIDSGIGMRSGEQICAFGSYNGGANHNAFLAPNVSNPDYQGTGLAVQWRTYSSQRQKRNVERMIEPLAVVSHDRLHGVYYDHINQDGTDGAKHQLGFVAEDWADIVPEVVGRNSAGEVDSMDYSRVGVITFQALKHYIARTDARIKELNDELKTLRARVAA